MKIAMFGIKGVPVPAGAENVAEQIGARLAQRGHQVTLYVRPHYTPASLKEHKGMRLVHLPSIPTKNLDAITHSLLACLAATASDAEVVHIHSTGNSVFAGLPRLFGKKTVVQSHGLDWQRAKWGWFARLYLRLSDYSTVHFPDATTAVSQKMTRYYQDMSKRPVTYIPNGIAPSEPCQPGLMHQLGLRGNDYIFLAARFVPEKGIHYLIEAYKQLETDKKLVLAGAGSYGDAYATRLLAHASEKIIFPGFVQGQLFEELISNAAFYVLPSEIEGLSLGLLEAMSYGNCVLVSDIEENLEVVGDSGCTFRAGDVADLRDKLQHLLANPGEVQAYRQRAKNHTRQHFNWEMVTDQFESLYRSIR